MVGAKITISVISNELDIDDNKIVIIYIYIVENEIVDNNGGDLFLFIVVCMSA